MNEAAEIIYELVDSNAMIIFGAVRAAQRLCASVRVPLRSEREQPAGDRSSQQPKRLAWSAQRGARSVQGALNRHVL